MPSPTMSGKASTQHINLNEHQTPMLFSCRVTKGQVMYTPAGWFVLEAWHKSPLLFGARKSVFIDLPACKASFAKSIALAEADGKDVAKMKIILSKFSV